MDWMPTPTAKRRLRKKRPHFEKSKSEPNLTEHFTPRFPHNLKHLIHEYITVDELKFYRKRKPSNIDDELNNKDHICLYDDSQPIVPFSALKTEYNKKFGKVYSPRSRSVPNKFDLNATTNELLEALRDDFSDIASTRLNRPKTANISGEIQIDGIDDLLKPNMMPYANVRQPPEPSKPLDDTTPNRRSCTLKLRGELSYSPEYRSEYKRHPTFERSQSIPQVNNIQFNGKFTGVPEYRDNYKTYDHFTKSEPIKAKDHLRVNPMTVNTAIISPIISPSSEYTDKFKEVNLRNIERTKFAKNMNNIGLKTNLIVGRSTQQIHPEYLDKFQDPKMKMFPERAKPKSPILSMSGNMDYKPEYRSTYIDFPRRRPVTMKPDTHFDLFERPRKTSPIRPTIITDKFNPRIAIIEPTKNIHHPTGIDDPTFLCRPEVRKARREILIKERPPSPSRTIAAVVRHTGDIFPTNEDEENHKYNERSRIVSPTLSPPIQVTIENFDEPNKKPQTILRQTYSPKYGRRASMQHASTVDAKLNSHIKRNQTKIIEGNSGYMKGSKKNSLTSTTTTTDEESIIGRSRKLLVSNKSMGPAPSFVILKEPCKENKWMKQTWYT